MLKAWDSALRTPGHEAPVWLLRIVGLLSKDVKGVLSNVGPTLAVPGAKAEKTVECKFIPAKDALVASATAVQTYIMKEK